jgi:hypothetical protein
MCTRLRQFQSAYYEKPLSLPWHEKATRMSNGPKPGPEGAPRAFRPGDDDVIDDAIDILTQVSLEALTLNPTRIGPFGAALLSWVVDGPPTGFSVELNGQRVGRRGQLVVQPRSSTTYTLVAVARGARRSLGSARLEVDLSGCTTFQLNNPKALVEGALSNAIEATENVYLRSQPAVTFAPGRVSFRLNLGYDLDRLPDPTIRIEGGFGLDVHDGQVIGVGQSVSADVSVPRYAWLIPGAMIALPIAISQAEQTARAAGNNAIAGLVNLIAFLSPPTDGMRRHRIRIDATDDGFGIIEVSECPFEELRALVAVSQQLAQSSPGQRGTESEGEPPTHENGGG